MWFIAEQLPWPQCWQSPGFGVLVFWCLVAFLHPSCATAECANPIGMINVGDWVGEILQECFCNTISWTISSCYTCCLHWLALDNKSTWLGVRKDHANNTAGDFQTFLQKCQSFLSPQLRRHALDMKVRSWKSNISYWWDINVIPSLWQVQMSVYQWF